METVVFLTLNDPPKMVHRSTNGGEVVGYYAATVGQDQSEKMYVTDRTWKEIERIGIENVRRFAEENGVLRTVSREGLTENEAETLIHQYRNASGNRRGYRGSAEMGAGIRKVSDGTSRSTGSESGISTDSGAFSLPEDTRYSASISFDDITLVSQSSYADLNDPPKTVHRSTQRSSTRTESGLKTHLETAIIMMEVR